MVIFSQTKEQEIPEVKVEVNRKTSSIDTIPILTSKDIAQLQCTDIGDLMNQLPGIQLRAYGGVGGLKTISVRGLGSQHSAIVLNGFTQVSSQTGQIDLGRVQVDGVESIAMHVGSEIALNLPVSADCFGNVLEVKTFNSKKSVPAWQLRNTNSVGSFGLLDHYLSMKKNWKKTFVSAEGKYRSFNGTYPYRLQNGLQEDTGKRYNNDLVALGGTVSLGYEGEKSVLLFQVQGQQVKQGLPGAVVLYLPAGNQRLHVGGLSTLIDYRKYSSRYTYRVYGSLSGEDIRYIDSSFLNNSGGINDLYSNQSVQLGGKANYHLNEYFTLQGGIEEQISRLSSTKKNFADPQRLHTFGELALLFRKKNWELDVLGSYQFVKDNVSTTQAMVNRRQLSPFIRVEKKKLLANRMALSAFYRRSFRIPSFNELYYNNIGNSELIPEIADQINIGLCYFPFKSSGILGFDVNVYQNWVQNKIVAIPTKNLFVWSIQNVGAASISGLDSRISSSYQKKQFMCNLSLNYSFQRVIDITSDAISYGQQLAYYPLHSGGGKLSFEYRKYGLTMNTYFIGSRYALNENIYSNLLEGFSNTDLGLFSSFTVKDHRFRIQCTIKNIFNQYYAYVRNYVMPGRNYHLSLSYALH